MSEAAAPPVIRLAGVSMRYGRAARAVEALHDVSFEVSPSRCTGLLGLNGSGKSTTLRLVLGLRRPVSGRVEVLGGTPGRREARARTGYVPEEARRFGRLTGIETIRMFGALQGVSPRRENRRRADEALELVGLEPAQGRRRVASYSRGMARRLAVAAAWVHRPELLVLDEPTSGLDPVGASRILDLLDRHRREGGATLLSTHDRSAAEEACDDLVVLRAGRVTAAGTPDALLAGDTTPSLARLLEAPARA